MLHTVYDVYYRVYLPQSFSRGTQETGDLFSLHMYKAVMEIVGLWIETSV